jgi:lysophospholipase L1-like esterase
MYGCVFLDIRQCGINPVNISNYMIDNLHPNAAGMELIANYIEKCLA